MVYKIPPMKHIVQNYYTGVNLSTQTVTILAVGTENPDPYTNVTNVRNGSIIRQIILQFDWISNTPTSPDSIDWYVWFNINGAQTRPTNTNPNLSHLKNQIFHQDGTITRGVQSTAVATVYPTSKSWRVVINLPRGYQQVNLGDQIEFVMTSSVNGTVSDYKLTAIYKEIFP